MDCESAELKNELSRPNPNHHWGLSGPAVLKLSALGAKVAP